MRRHDAEKFGEGAILIGIVVERLDRQYFVKEIFFPGNLLRRSSDIENIFKLGRRLAGPADHFVGYIETYDLSEALRAIADESRQKACSPAGAASQIEHTFAGAKVHDADGFFRDVEMMALHLLAFTLMGPAVEFVLEFFVGSLGFIGHSPPWLGLSAAPGQPDPYKDMLHLLSSW